MTVREGEIEQEETEEEVQNRESEEARTAELETLRKEKQDAQLEAARAQGEAEALKKNIHAPVQAPQWTDDQWDAEGAKRGMTGQQLKATAEISAGIAGQQTSALRQELENSKAEISEAKAEAKKAKTEASLYNIEREFFEKNPALTGRRADVDEFLADFPESVKEDPKKYAALLEKAKVYVRGKAREDIALKRGKTTTVRGNSEREEFTDDTRTDVTETELDLSDLDNDGAKSLISRLHKNPGPENGTGAPALDEVSLDKAFEISSRKDGRGVSIDESGEWNRGKRKQEQSLKEARK